MRKIILGNIAKIDTPCYLYDRQSIQENIQRLKKHFAACHANMYFAVKANTSLAVLRTVKNAGMGAEVVSPGELYTTRKAGFVPSRILYNTIARCEKDIRYAVRNRVRRFNFEALDQAEMLEACARAMHTHIELFARINPGIFPDTHPHLSTGAPLSKFGLEITQLPAITRMIRGFRNATMVGIHSHIGSQILTPSPFVRNTHVIGTVLDFFRKEGVMIRSVNLGGGFGVPYHPREKPLDYRPITRAYKDLTRRYGVAILLEPGRSVVSNAGAIVTRVMSVKTRRRHPLYIIDAGMTENIRPALYGAYHHIESLSRHAGTRHRARIAGPLCENSDEFGMYMLPELKRGDLLLIYNCGAYTRTMASNYNGRLLPAEYMIERDRVIMVRKHEPIASLVRNEIH
ncbi:diaminopimelate decarboxylase [candidate division WOR-3 bacterium]|nr:diaminopimelate decarboxylase [candidate division WOR-3 bacterium]